MQTPCLKKMNLISWSLQSLTYLAYILKQHKQVKLKNLTTILFFKSRFNLINYLNSSLIHVNSKRNAFSKHSVVKWLLYDPFRYFKTEVTSPRLDWKIVTSVLFKVKWFYLHFFSQPLWIVQLPTHSSEVQRVPHVLKEQNKAVSCFLLTEQHCTWFFFFI